MKLLDQVRDVIREKYYSIRAEQAYVILYETLYIIPQKKSPKIYGNEFYYRMMSKEDY